jgi:hypothetical protein
MLKCRRVLSNGTRLALTVLLLFGLSACGGGSVSETAATAVSSSQPDASSGTDLSGESGGTATTTPASLASGTAGRSYEVELQASTLVSGMSWSVSSGMPPGLTYAPGATADRLLISGIPNQAGTYEFTVSILANGEISSSRFRIVVDAGTGTSTSTALSVDASGVGQATLGTAYSANITGSGGEGSYSWSLSGTLPAGLSWAEAADNLSIDITGTPTQAGQFQFAVNLQTAGDSVSETLSITVVETIEPVALTTSSVPAATKDSAYSTTLQASGGVAPFSWSISSGTLPAGLSLDSSSTLASVSLSGTPTESGSYSFSVQVTSDGQSTSRDYQLTVADGGTTGGGSSDIEGFGRNTLGALSSPTGYETYMVTSLADSGPGTLRDAISQEKRLIQFAVAGEINPQTDILIKKPYITIDGASAPAPGITLKKTQRMGGALIVGGTHDVVIQHIRVWGAYKAGDGTVNNAGTLGIDGDWDPDYVARNIVLDHITARNATDSGPDIWGEVQDVTVSWNLIFHNYHPTTISHYPSPYQTRQRISMHHNVYAENGERNPQIRGDVQELDYVNNIVYGWGWANVGCYGIRIKNDWANGEPQSNLNIVNNHFLTGPAGRCDDSALIYGWDPGPDQYDGGPSGTPEQGTVIDTSRMGSLWVNGNILPSANRDHYSTIAQPLFIPSEAQVTTWPASELRDRVLPGVGMKFRDAEEQALLNDIKNSDP